MIGMLNRGLWAVLGVLVITSGPPAFAEEPISVHHQALIDHRDDPAPPATPAPAETTRTAARAWEEDRGKHSRAQYEVIGYLPYWEGTSGLRLDVLTQVNWFAAEMNSTGDLTDLHGWGDSSAQNLMTEAHAAGCRFVLVTTNFSSSGIHGVVSSPTNRANAIDNLLEQVLAMGADGVDIDFEGMDTADKDDLVTFMAELTAAFEAEITDPWITLATPAIDWGGAYDYDELIYNSSGLFIMGYAYHWSGGDPGPVAPKEGGGAWSNYSLTWTVEDYMTYGGEENRKEIYLGLPLYGRDWPSTSDSVPGTATDDGVAIWIEDAIDDAATHGELWDATTSTPYYVYQSGGWHQVWYDNADSVMSKIDLVEDYDLGGFGFWALQYDGNDPELWDAIEALNNGGGDDDDDDATGPGAPVAVVDAHVYSNVGLTVTLDGSESYDPDGDALTYSWTQVDGEEVALTGADQALATFEADFEGLTTFELVVSDGAAQSEPAIVEVRVFPADEDDGCRCTSADHNAAPAMVIWMLLAAVWTLRRSR